MDSEENITENVVTEKVIKIKHRNPFSIQQQKDDKEKRRQKKARIIIRNISYKSTDETLRKHFEKYGTILDLHILKKPDGKLVGCAFIQYEKVNEAAKAILKLSNKPFLGRPIFLDWALGKNEYENKKNFKKEIKEEKIKIEIENEENKEEDEDIKEESVNENEEDESMDENEKDESISENDDFKDETLKIKSEEVKKKKISNDVQEGCTIFIKNVPLDATNQDLHKVCRKYGPIYYAIVNTDPISKYSRGTAFVKFKTKDSADFCLTAGEEFVLMNTVMEPLPALSRQDVTNKTAKNSESTDSRNLYLVKEGLIMTGSKSADGVSAADLAKRHKLEQVKAAVLKDLNRFVSRNRLSIHNLPSNYDDEKLKKLIIEHTQLRPHECRIMLENKPSPGFPKGKSKEFGFMSFSTHLDALTALRKLNNNPKIFGPTNRPIVGFSIEDRSVHNIKQKRLQKSIENNPTYKNKLEKIKQKKKDKKLQKLQKSQNDEQDIKNKKNPINHKMKNKILKNNQTNCDNNVENLNDFVGMPAKKGTFIRMRSNKKIREQSLEHKKKLSEIKRKDKQRKEKRMHLMERKQVDRTKIGKKKSENDNFSMLVKKYKNIVDSRAENQNKSNKKLKSKWYVE